MATNRMSNSSDLLGPNADTNNSGGSGGMPIGTFSPRSPLNVKFSGKNEGDMIKGGSYFNKNHDSSTPNSIKSAPTI